MKVKLNKKFLSNIVEKLHVENVAISVIIMIVIRECDYYI